MKSNTELLEQARTLATQEHQGQIDKLGHPYIAHVAHVAQIVASKGAEYEIVAWLHDIVEDCDVSLDDIGLTFGPIIRRAVDAMTRRKGEGYFSTYLPRVMENPFAIVVKHADASHNRAKGHLLADQETALSLQGKYTKVISRLVDAQPQLIRQACFEHIEYRDGKWIS